MKKFDTLFGWMFIIIFSINAIISFTIASIHFMQYKTITSTVAFNVLIGSISAVFTVLTYKRLINENNN